MPVSVLVMLLLVVVIVLAVRMEWVLVLVVMMGVVAMGLGEVVVQRGRGGEGGACGHEKGARRWSSPRIELGSQASRAGLLACAGPGNSAADGGQARCAVRKQLIQARASWCKLIQADEPMQRLEQGTLRSNPIWAVDRTRKRQAARRGGGAAAEQLSISGGAFHA
jgi:hypothetical protein